MSPALGKEESGAIGVAIDEPMSFSENQRAEVLETSYTHQLTTGGGKPGQGYLAARIGMLVRRLTPRECERLQGFPDDWTAVDGLPEYAQTKNGSWRSKTGTPDSRRYSATGDAVTVNVIEWIGRRIVAVTNQPKGPNDEQDISVSAHESAEERDGA